MNRLIQEGRITELASGTNFAYVLNDSSLFSSTQYKVMHGQDSRCVLKCMKMLYNGKLQFFYLTNSLKPLSTLIPSLDGDMLTVIVKNLFSSIIDVKQTGFLSCRNLEVSFDKIFVDPSTMKVRLVYIPTGEGIHGDESAFENEIRSNLVKLIGSSPVLSTPKTIQLATYLTNGMMSLKEILSKLGASSDGGSHTPPPPGKARLVSTGAGKLELEITKGSFTIGKNPNAVDGVISINNMISRVHCRVDRSAATGAYRITDLRSANGTFVNGSRLLPDQSYPIKDGDLIRLANSEFRFSISSTATSGGSVWHNF